MPEPIDQAIMGADELVALYQAPFFEDLDPDDVAVLVEHAALRRFAAGERLLEEDAPADCLYLLVQGAVELSFHGTGDEGDVSLRAIGDPGYPVGWSVMVAPYRYRATATALEPVRALALERTMLERYARDHPAFGVAMMQRLLWALGRRLREARIRLVVRHFHEEALAIRALLAQSASELPVASALHKIPYYLENRLTLSDAFDVLEVVHVHGEGEHERYLAGLCLEILKSVRLELSLFQHLQRIYDLVAGAPEGEPPEAVNRRCMEETVRLFEGVPHVLRGLEHLPARPGHLFVMNHLYNHPHYLLPNHFHFTLDTHFVSAVLFRHYGQAPVRVVRKSDPAEYGHQRYYDHLGHLYVYSGGNAEEQRTRRAAFFEQGAAHLRAGRNVVICPAGSSTGTEASPLPFKTGAFRLAARAHPEPLIVPVAVAYFDKKITRRRPVAVVHPPLRLSEHVGPEPTSEDVSTFAEELHGRFTTWVREAAALSGESCRWL